MKKYYLTLITVFVLIILGLWYWYSPWTLKKGFRLPHNYNECLSVGGKEVNLLNDPKFIFPGCSYQGKIFDPSMEGKQGLQ